MRNSKVLKFKTVYAKEKNVKVQLFCVFEKRIRNRQLICTLSSPLLQDNFLEPFGHRTGQLLEVVEGHVGDPHELDRIDQLGEKGDVAVVLQLSLHVAPTILEFLIGLRSGELPGQSRMPTPS